MSVTITINSIESGLDEVTISGTLAFSSVYAAGGDAIDWTTVNGVFDGNGRIFLPSALPDCVLMHGSGLFLFGYVPGTTLANGKVKINDIAAAAQLANGAYPAGITADAGGIFFTAKFPRLL